MQVIWHELYRSPGMSSKTELPVFQILKCIVHYSLSQTNGHHDIQYIEGKFLQKFYKKP